MSETPDTSKYPFGDPCAEFGPKQKFALVWFMAIMLVAGFMTVKLSGIDLHMWETDGIVLDYEQYRDNRSSFTSIPSSPIDPRQDGNYSSAARHAAAPSR